MKIYKFAAGIYGANCYIVVDEITSKTMIIDPGGSPEELLEFISRKELEPEYIVLTHGHADHIGGVLEIKNRLAVPIIAHEEESELLKDADKNLSRQMLPKPVEIKNYIALKDGDKFKLGEIEVDIIHTPGHTQGGMCLKIGEDLFSGDTLFKSSIGRGDLYGGNPELLIKSIKEKLLILSDNTKVWPGHGEATTISQENLSNPYLK